jgi:hypothetical protein
MLIGALPVTAISANFPADSFGFTGSDGLLLESESLQSFLTTVGKFIGVKLDVASAMSQVFCTVTGSDGTEYTFDDTQTYVFAQGSPINVVAYRCVEALSG